MTNFFDDAWLADYLAKHPDLAARMVADAAGVSPQVSIPAPAGDAADEPEGVLLAKVRRCALENGWLFYHTHDSRRSDFGYPDCTLAKPGHPLFVWELKTRTGKATMEQLRWLEFFRQATGVEAALYRPADFPTMEALLTRRTRDPCG